MDWNLYWAIILQIAVFAFAFPFLCLPVGIGISFVIRRLKQIPTDRVILYGANGDHD